MKNVHLLFTNTPKVIGLNQIISNQDKTYLKINDFIGVGSYTHLKPCNLYITNSEEIREGEWCLDKFNQIWKLENNKLIAFDGKGIKRFSTDNISGHDCKKITLTTNPELIKDKVQSINDEFLKWFVRNPNCEEVVIERYCRNGFCDGSGMCRYLCECIGKRIAIPKEELIVVETTLEDFRVKPKDEIKRDFVNNTSKWNIEDFEEPKQDDLHCFENIDFGFGVKEHYAQTVYDTKYQQKQDKKLYSEEDMLLAFETGRNFQLTGENNFKELIDNLKK